VSNQLVKVESGAQGGLLLPQIVTGQDQKTVKRFLEFFAVTIRNENTRAAYARAVVGFFNWCEFRGASFEQIEPLIIAAYIEEITSQFSAPTVQQHLAAIRMLYDWLVTGGVVATNPASAVKAPKFSKKTGKTPVLQAEEMRRLLDGINTESVIGLRDRALIGLMFYSFARVSAVLKMRVRDYYPQGKRFFVRLHEKGGKFHVVPVHHRAEEYLDQYIERAGIAGEKNSPLFRTVGGRGRDLSKNGMSRFDAWAMIKRRRLEAGIIEEISPHTMRGTGITIYLQNGGTLEKAQQIAAHESAQTTKLYDRTDDEITLDEIERIAI
jgi:site-specific recombinase XerD